VEARKVSGRSNLRVNELQDEAMLLDLLRDVLVLGRHHRDAHHRRILTAQHRIGSHATMNR
jgi:hypothetical protein